MDKQEQLLARKTATLGMGKSVAELTNENSTDDEEVNELLELELKKRKQRMDRASGLSAGTTTGNIQSSQTSLSTSTVNYSETSRQQTINKSPINTGLFFYIFMIFFVKFFRNFSSSCEF